MLVVPAVQWYFLSLNLYMSFEKEELSECVFHFGLVSFWNSKECPCGVSFSVFQVIYCCMFVVLDVFS